MTGKNKISIKERWRWFLISFFLLLFALSISILAGVALYALYQSQDRQDTAIASVCSRQDNVIGLIDQINNRYLNHKFNAGKDSDYSLLIAKEIIALRAQKCN
jgi:uncharacterized protein YpmS